ncbi:MAG TPA: hypothetical protein PK542_02080 [Treponemataceae bacterium]|nr:hypothetical protein [Treponemataceae bacterium]HPS43256.1 hypothetical protein [Treponemataceae bacterium]
MDKVTICHACGRTIDAAFFYCPWCGTAATGDEHSEAHPASDIPEALAGSDIPEIAERMNAVFGRLTVLQTAWTDSRLDRMESELVTLERALSDMLSETKIS